MDPCTACCTQAPENAERIRLDINYLFLLLLLDCCIFMLTILLYHNLPRLYPYGSS